MLAVEQRPCVPAEYNDLPDVMVADAALRDRQDRVEDLVEAGAAVCRDSPLPHGEVGAFLLHKHWPVGDGECLVERPGRHPSGLPALVTRVEPHRPPGLMAPSRFRVDLDGGRLVALEFSTDPAVAAVWQTLASERELLEALSSAIGGHGLADQMGLAIYARSTLPITEGDELIEENWDGMSVLTAQVPTAEHDTVFVKTGWPFASPRDDDPVSATCIAYCMLAGGAHCRHHYNRPAEVLPE